MRIIITIVLLVFLLNNTNTNAQGNSFAMPLKKINTLNGTFSGKITDAQTGAAVEGATVYISDIKSGTATGGDGHFIINKIPQGTHLVEISHVGYSSIVENIEITADVKKDYVLTESIIENNAVVVTGVTGATQLKKVPFAVSVMRKEDFFSNSSSNIIESLTKISEIGRAHV